MFKYLFLSILICFPFWGISAQTSDPSEISKQRLNKIADEAGYAAQPVYREGRGLRTMVMNIFKVFLSLLGVIFFLLTLHGGFQWATAGGDSKQTEEAKKRITNGIIGLLIIISAYGISVFIAVNVQESVVQYEYDK